MARGAQMVENYRITARFDGSADDNLKAAGFSRSMITRLRKELGLIRVVSDTCPSGQAVFATAKVRKGDILKISLPVSPVAYPASNISPEFAYIDDDIAVVVKPSGIATVPIKSHYKDSYASVLASAWGEFVYRPVGRLDKDTSGLLIVARSSLAASRMHDMQNNGAIGKQYTALVQGIIPESGEIDAPLALSQDGHHREVSENGKPAKTLFRRIGIINENSLAEFTLLSGRTHQIRVHSAYIGHPVCGDALYNPRAKEFPRLMLHCSRLCFAHPFTGDNVTVESPFPPTY